MDDIYLQNCAACQRRYPVRYMVAIAGKRYCGPCGIDLRHLIRSQEVEIAPAAHAANHHKGGMERRPNRQRERNKGKPDVMQAKVPPRRNKWP